MSQRHAFPRRTPVTFVITLLSVATILAGCGFTDATGSPPEASSAEDDRPEDDRVDGDRADDDPRLGGHEVVWQVHPPLGLVPVTVAQTAVPTMTVYGDGLVLMADGVDHSASAGLGHRSRSSSGGPTTAPSYTATWLGRCSQPPWTTRASAGRRRGRIVSWSCGRSFPVSSRASDVRLAHL